MAVRATSEAAVPARTLAIESLLLRNVLSFGAETEPLDLGPLNVLIGPNGSGKSNVLEVFALLARMSLSLREASTLIGRADRWLWFGAPEEASALVQVRLPAHELAEGTIVYGLEIEETWGAARFAEHVATDRTEGTTWHFRTREGKPYVRVSDQELEVAETYRPQESVLSQFRGPAHPEITAVASLFKSIRVYRDWFFGRDSPARRAQPADLPDAHLSEDCSNLGMVLNRLRQDSRTRRKLTEHLRAFYEDVEEMDVSVHAGRVQVFLHEKPFSSPIPATRLSEGTLRWICLLAVLLDPQPPPLVCLEEPEIGLHPDMLPELATLLRDASTRMQLIVTTHSDALVDALSEVPEAVLVCEKEQGATHIRRLDRAALSVWLERYTLGQLWRRGEIGGNRW